MAIVREHWPLLELRRRLIGDTAERRVPLPARLAQLHIWVLLRAPGGVGHLALEPMEGELMTLVQQHAVGEALARLEQSCDEAERAELPSKVQRWLARSVELGFWAGIET
jgi:hypothetical protein